MIEAAFDAARLEDLRGSMSSDDLSRLMDLVAEDFARRLASMHAALARLDRTQLALDAHSTVGVAGTIGATTLSIACEALNTAAASAAPAEDLRRLLKDVTCQAIATAAALDGLKRTD